MTSSVAIQIAYGLEVQSHDDSRLVLLQSVVDEAIKACQPGEFESVLPVFDGVVLELIRWVTIVLTGRSSLMHET